MKLISKLRKTLFNLNNQITIKKEEGGNFIVDVHRISDVNFWVGFRFTEENNSLNVYELLNLHWNKNFFVNKLIEMIIYVSRERNLTGIEVKLKNEMKEHTLLLETFKKFDFKLSEGEKDFTHYKKLV